MAFGQKEKNLDYHFACIATVKGFANENPKTKEDALVLAAAYDLQKMERCMLDLSSMFKKAQAVAMKASKLAGE